MAAKNIKATVANNAPENTFPEIMKSIPQADIEAWLSDFTASVDARKMFEKKKAKTNANIQKNLDRYHKNGKKPCFAAFCIAANVPPSFVMGKEREGALYNVYAMDKLINLGSMLYYGNFPDVNKHMRAVLHNIQVTEQEKVPFTYAMAKASVSDKLPLDAKWSVKFRRNNEAEGTGAGQGSPVMRALQTCGIVRVVDEQRNKAYRANKNPLTAYIAELVAQ
ncbi:hypothetical protein F1188_16225 [Roseospira marina]|uniref:Uncharacterized protein n=1 Tax=Roseospira marina TaxID=140057 RepID=A0A5M6I843_9PROT|nr:hypothetical protein [Roseospira marina]KAA5604406.1 hypothetical protein F1188_16225 [Roseospira marina]MBB4315401.1 ribosome biogenesis protein Nip4 [Roseospira marina]MBB5088454.1 ribosome biogenesis protein Nip4 [Roseospira marina]